MPEGTVESPPIGGAGRRKQAAIASAASTADGYLADGSRAIMNEMRVAIA
jgi:hypothetical protein